jgi:hypothetical protein
MAAEDRRLDALTAGDLRMAAAIRPSFDRLRADAQELFRRLALVDGTTFGAGLAGALIGQPAGAAESLLDELTDSSLVQPVAADRYTLHALLRLYARAELEHEPPAARAAIQAAADDWLVATAARVARTLRHDTRPAPFTDAELADTSRHRELARAWLVDEADNWRAAVGRVLRRDRGGTPGVAAAASWLHGSGPMLWWPSGASPDGVRPGDAASSSSPGRRPVQLVTGARPMADLVRGHAHVVEPWAPAARTVPCRADSGR